MAIIDQRGDNSRSLWHKITCLYELPEFVKEASADRRSAATDEPNANMFADKDNLLFPMHNPEAVLTSALYAIEQKDSIDRVKYATVIGRLRDAAEYFNITAALEGFEKRATTLQQVDQIDYPDSDFAIVHLQNGSKQRYIRLSNMEEVKVAADWFRNYQDSFAFNDRVTIATRILEKSQQHNVKLAEDVSDFLETRAGLGTCSALDAAAFVVSRVDRARNKLTDEDRQDLLKLASVIKDNPQHMHQPTALLKLAEQMDSFDRTYGLASEYVTGLERPEEVLFRMTKTALAAHLDNHVYMTSGRIYEKQAFVGMRHEDLEAHMGSDLASEVTSDGIHVDTEKLAEILPTLPRGDAERFDSFLSTIGVAPVMKKAAEERVGLTQEELIAFAEQYQPMTASS